MIMDSMGWLAWLAVGALAGGLADFIVPNGLGLRGDALIGGIGGLFAGFLFQSYGELPVEVTSFGSIFFAFVGAVLLLALVRVYKNRRKIQAIFFKRKR
jgi:uncharacterized membrane protein YeaQ/YmgE (transglycosylase-associated protein family)